MFHLKPHLYCVHERTQEGMTDNFFKSEQNRDIQHGLARDDVLEDEKLRIC